MVELTPWNGLGAWGAYQPDAGDASAADPPAP
jgi:hypothetical protein